MRSLADVKDETIKHIPYAAVIGSCRGPESVTKIIIASIDPDIMELEGKVVTRRMCVTHICACNTLLIAYRLDGILEKQAKETNPWSDNSGYLACDTLHYYLIWKGNGHRTADFIRLCTLILPDGMDEGILAIFNNILVMVMARVFQSLPPKTLEEWFGAIDQTSSMSSHHSCKVSL